MSIDVSAIKQGQRAMWALGDYPEASRAIAEVAGLLAGRAGAEPGVELLDVATGSGNVAMAAARAGATVTGLDLTPELLEVARARARTNGLEIEFLEGDAEDLPFAADTFDRVTSCFGVMFAPRQQTAAAELVRVARPGGQVAVTAWTPGGLMGEMFRTVSSYMPPPPPELTPPVMWGVEDHVRGLFAGTGVELSFERLTVDFLHDSPEAYMEFTELNLGPAIAAKTALEPRGRYDELRSELIGLYSESNQADDGTLSVAAEYLLTLATLPG